MKLTNFLMWFRTTDPGMEFGMMIMFNKGKGFLEILEGW